MKCISFEFYFKIINRTANLSQNGPTRSSGVWQTTFIGLELSDQLLYNRRGEYHRYLNTETVLTIVLAENHFYVENEQRPIAYRSEANFHTILFMSLSLEMFCLTFLTFKLMFVPLFRVIERRILLRSRVTSEVFIEKTKDLNELGTISAASPLENINVTPEHTSPHPQHISPHPQHTSPHPQHISPHPQHTSPYPQHISPHPQHTSPQLQQSTWK